MTLPHELPQHFWAISIEGIGDEKSPPGSQHNGWLITTQGARPYIDIIEARTDWTVRPWLQVDSLDVAGESVEIFESHIQWGAVSGELMADDLSAERFLSTQFRGEAIVDSRIQASDSTVELSDTTLEGEVVYIGDETLELTSHQGGGVYDAIRDQYGSEPRGHDPAAPVFTKAPYFDARRVQLFAGTVVANNPDGATDPGVVLDQKQLALLVGNMVQNKGRLTFSTRSAGARLKEIKGGEESREMPVGDFGFILVDDELAGMVGQTDDGSQILKADALGGQLDRASAIQFGDYAHPVDVLTDTSTSPNEPRGLQVSQTSSRGGFLWGEEPDKDLDGLDDSGQYSEPMYEIFAVDQRRGVTPMHVIADALGDEYRWHRLTYYAAFHLSTRQAAADPSSFDVLTPDASLSARWLFVDDIVDRIKTLIERHQAEREKVRRIALGVDNEPWGIRDFCVNDLLHPFYYESVTPQGELTIERVRTPDIDDIDTALGRPVKPWPDDTLKQDPARDRTKTKAQVTVGNTELTEGRSVVVRNNANLQNRSQAFDNGKSLDVSASVADPLRVEGRRRPPIANRISDQLQLQGTSHDVLTFLAPNPDELNASYRVGEFIQLDDLELQPEWVVDGDGNRVQDFSEKEAVGLIVSRKLYAADDQRSRAYELGVLFIGDTFARWRAPSGKIQSVTTTNSNHILTLGGDDGGDSQFGLDQPDASYFAAGDEVELYNRDGTYWSGNTIKEVTDVSGTDITVDGTWSSTPSAGLYVRLAHLDSDGSGAGYQNDGLDGRFDNISRPYVYLADTSGTTGDADVGADSYGV